MTLSACLLGDSTISVSHTIIDTNMHTPIVINHISHENGVKSKKIDSKVVVSLGKTNNPSPTLDKNGVVKTVPSSRRPFVT